MYIEQKKEREWNGMQKIKTESMQSLRSVPPIQKNELLLDNHRSDNDGIVSTLDRFPGSCQAIDRDRSV